jgi:hypothetical protein
MVGGGGKFEVFTMSLCMRMAMITHICTFPVKGENFSMTGFYFCCVTFSSSHKPTVGVIFS